MVAAQVAAPPTTIRGRSRSPAIPYALRNLAKVARRDASALLALVAGWPRAWAIAIVNLARDGLNTTAVTAISHPPAVCRLQSDAALPLSALAFPCGPVRPTASAFMDTVHAFPTDGEVSLFGTAGAAADVQVLIARPPVTRLGRAARLRTRRILQPCGRGVHWTVSPRLPVMPSSPGLQRVIPRDTAVSSTRDGVSLGSGGNAGALDPCQQALSRRNDAVSHDGRVSVAEAELLRTICGVLHCPLPPMLERG